MGEIITICNQKGGVGKTTTAINLSAFLAVNGHKVLVIDVDPQSNATSGIGAKREDIKSTIYNVLLNQVTLQEIILPTEISNLYIAPADINLTGAQIELVSAFNREQILKKALRALYDLYDYIIIDCPPSLGLLTINALTASHSILIPLQCEYYAMEGLSQLLNTIKLIQDNLNPGLGIKGVVLTMADYRTKLTNEVIKEAKVFFGEKVYNTVIPRSIKLSEAPGHGKPIVLYDRYSQGAVAYKEFSEEFARRNSLPVKELEQKGGANGKEKGIREGVAGANI